MAYKYIAEEWADREKSFVEELNRQRISAMAQTASNTTHRASDKA